MNQTQNQNNDGTEIEIEIEKAYSCLVSAPESES